MGKRKYAKMQELLPVIRAMQAAGQSHKEIEEELGLSGDRPIHNLLKRERRKQARLESGLIPGSRGRPRKRENSTLEECQQEIRRLKMENELLRDFLRLTERE